MIELRIEERSGVTASFDIIGKCRGLERKQPDLFADKSLTFIFIFSKREGGIAQSHLYLCGFYTKITFYGKNYIQPPFINAYLGFVCRYTFYEGRS